MYFNDQQLAYSIAAAMACQMMLYKKSNLSVRHKFSSEEDSKLKKLVEKYGENDWTTVASEMKTRTARQCRERFKNYLSPKLTNGPWTEEEDKLLEEKFNEYGPKWAKIAVFFPSRSDVNVKNHWTSLANKISRRTPHYENDQSSNSPSEVTPMEQNHQIEQKVNQYSSYNPQCAPNKMESLPQSPNYPISPPSPSANFPIPITTKNQPYEISCDGNSQIDFNEMCDFDFDNDFISEF
ncbi:Myb-like DNA-binding domain containing protein [Trichomonas vaginalis G3]|uniref:Myb-like DNA-binding domain containing protein n=1 Tax=Trichomonas vaginalis (strain ATCC PRA-98 / G3) TaxID=412133 RepID=A2EUW6_TRIV3|nr:RNA polymerase II transcription regulator recruiting protein [Trichomonas vaginalis G3]EAY03575.1 Myb-like DNA-binding domain containing protein [Trichomonas vaginalis G3]KAI5550081.1 RNA polymerase II transcription regulator recruiting protein [Trichomonas vaginalis G3]|eukprot:XP_001315798.1 Myb-like DNA-binding domain containing protein [Trichomonas vaginalis G3]